MAQRSLRALHKDFTGTAFCPRGLLHRQRALRTVGVMGSVATITPASLAVQPGSQADGQIRVRNTGSVVDQFSFQALGDAAPWISFEPASLSLFPGDEGTVRLIARPPRGPQTPPGLCPVGVRVDSKEDPDHPAIEELTLEVGRLSDIFAELVPRTSRARLRALHELAVDNSGNDRLNATLSASDPDDRLRFAFDPPALVAEPGMAAFSRVAVRPLRRFLWGPAVTHSFRVLVQPDGDAPLTAEGVVLQEPVLPRWTPRALAGLVALLLALAALWAALLRPAIESAAKDAVDEPLAELGNKVAAVEKATTGTTTAPVGPEATTDTTEAVSALGNPFDVRLASGTKGAGAADTQKFRVGDDQRFSLTDVLLQNPAGDAGTLEVRRGDKVMLRVNLANFRDLDYHFVSPIVFNGGEDVVLFVQCGNPPDPAPGVNCTPAAYLTGFMKAA